MEGDRIRATFTDSTGTKHANVTLRNNLTATQVIERLITNGFIPEISSIDTSYILTRKLTGEALRPDYKFSELGIKDGDIIIVGKMKKGGEEQPKHTLPDDIAKSLVEQLISKVSVGTPIDEEDVKKLEKIEKLFENIEGYLKPSAPIIMDPQNFAIRAVRADLLTYMEDYRSDENKWHSVSWAFLGAILGMAINWVTSPGVSITSSAIILLGVFLIITLIAWNAAREYGKRARQLKEEMLLGHTET